MAEIGIIASIIGVAGAGFRLSLILNAVSCEVAGAAIEVQNISKSVTLFSLMLKQTSVVLQAADSVHSEEAVDTAHQIAEESTRVFDEINNMLDQVRTKRADGSLSPTVQQRFKWCFKKGRVAYLLGQLESLKLSLSVMLQILQLGKLMASTSKSDPPEIVAIKKEAINQERAETQNVVIIRYWQISDMDALFEACRREEEGEEEAGERRQVTIDDHNGQQSVVTTRSSQLTIEAPPPEYANSTVLVKLPVPSLGELDQTLHKIKESPKDMLQVSNEAIDPLLERWTIWREIRERRHSGIRFVPSVQNVDEEDTTYFERYREREDSPRGYFLEGPTTDWRMPHSVAARYEASQRRKQYSNYQPSVSAASSDVEDSVGSKTSKKPSPGRHIIDSSPESSDPELEKAGPRRRSSGPSTTERKVQNPEAVPLAHSYEAVQPRRASNSPGAPASLHPGFPLSGSLQHPSNVPRPYATPDQSMARHSVSAPPYPLHTTNAPNPYAGHSVPYPPHPGPFSPYGSQHGSRPRYVPPTGHSPRMGTTPRPGSQDDGRAGRRSPSRLSHMSPGSRSQARMEDEKKHSREQTKKSFREGATKGLLGAGAIAGFLEALESLSI